MSGKRQRPTDMEIDEKTLQYKQKAEKEEEQDNISERKIYKIKKPNTSEEGNSSKINFTLANNSEATDNTKLFSSNNNVTIDRPKDENNKFTELLEKKSPSELFGANKGFGIFQLPQKKPEESEKKSSLFSNQTKPSIFNLGSSNNSSPSIFSNSKNSIFNFNNGGIPPIKKGQTGSLFASKEDDCSDGEDGSQQLEKDQENEIDPSKSHGKYEYKEECNVLFCQKALKYKKDAGDLIENVDVIIQQESETKINWIVIRLRQTKNKIFTGALVKGKSEIKNFGGKTENVSVTAAEIKKQIQKHVLKVQFDNKEKAEKFMKVFNELE